MWEGAEEEEEEEEEEKGAGAEERTRKMKRNIGLPDDSSSPRYINYYSTYHVYSSN